MAFQDTGRLVGTNRSTVAPMFDNLPSLGATKIQTSLLDSARERLDGCGSVKLLSSRIVKVNPP